MDFKLTELLAIYGALLSTFVFFWNISKSKRRIKVKVTYGLEGDGDDIQSGIYVAIQNPSPSVIHISGMSLLYPWKEVSLLGIVKESIKYKRWFNTFGWVHSSLSLYGHDDGCPVSIEPGASHNVFVPDVILSQVMEDAVSNRIRVSVQDQLWNETNSKPLDIDNILKKENT